MAESRSISQNRKEENLDFASTEMQTKDSRIRAMGPETATDDVELADIPNYLTRPSDVEVLQQVEDFVTEKGLTKFMRLFKTAALVAHHPKDFEHINDPIATGEFDYANLRPLEEEELEYLRTEQDHKRWHHPRELYWTVVVCSVGAAVQGWDQTASNGANLFFPAALGIPIANSRDTDSRNFWLVGFINAAPYISSAFIGCWLAEPLNNYLGRRGTIFVAGIFCFLPVLCSAFVQTWEQLLICRLLLGLGMGAKATSVPIFAAENAPASIRGALVMCWQMWVAFGIFLGVSTNLIVWNTGSDVWRLQLGLAAIPAVPLLLGIYLCPESPRWYMKKGRYTRAFASLRRLRNTDIQAARDLFSIHAQLKHELMDQQDQQARQNGLGEGYFKRLLELFTETKRIRPATIAAITVMTAQQMCGINIVAFYSSTIFQDAGASPESALWGSWGFGLINFIFAIPALYTIDSWGRRTLLLFTFPQMAWTLLAAGFCSLIANTTAHVVLVGMFIFIFSAFYSVGEGPVPFTLSAEVFPLSHREVGMGFAVATNLFWAAVLTITFPRMLDAMGAVGAFGFYAGLNVLALILIFLFMPETKQLSLEDLDHIFQTSATKFARYQITETVPHILKRVAHPRSHDTRKDLYSFAVEEYRER